MLAFLLMGLLYLIILLFLVGLGTGVGFLLHALIPAVDQGMGTLIGLVAAALALHFLGRLLELVPLTTPASDFDDLDEELEVRPGVRLYPLTPLPPLPRRRRRKS